MILNPKYKALQESIIKETQFNETIAIEDIKTICAMDSISIGKNILCIAVVLEYPSLTILEKKQIITSTQIN